MDTTIEKTIFINAAPEAVWEYLVDKDKLGEWYHPAKANLVAGEAYTLTDSGADADSEGLIRGRVIESTAPTKLVVTFMIKPLGDNETTVTWTLVPAAGGTRLHLRHEGVAEAAGAGAMGLLMALDKGWDEHFGKLRPLPAVS